LRQILALPLRRWMKRRFLAWIRLSPAMRDTITIIVVSSIIWYAIERTDTCDRFFDWVAENLDYEIDSIILAFLLGSIGITIAICRRCWELQQTSAARDEAKKHAHQLAYHDTLTGLPNRRALNERLGAVQARNPENRLGLIIVDLDRFKSVNDLHGHAAGDRLLRQASQRMLGEAGQSHAVYRLGGDEFAILVDMCGLGDDAPHTVARHIVQCMS
jgi:GGDEF domain-containing protein